MFRTGSSAAGAAVCGPPQATALSAKPIATIELNARQFSVEPLMELSYDILLGHDHAACMRAPPQPQLIELTHLCVFCHDHIVEIHHVAHLELGISQCLQRKLILDAQF